MKNKYELQYDRLIAEYDLYYEQKSDSTMIHNLLIDLFKTKCEGKIVALWGAGRKNTENSHAAVILKKYTTYIQGIQCIIDSLPELQGDEFMGYPIIAPNQILEHKVNMVIIASKVQSDSIIKDLARYAPECEYIDIYGELRNRGILIYQKFYEESNIYTTMYQLRHKMETDSSYNRQIALHNLISGYLSIQDFYYAEHFAGEYFEKKYDEWERLQKFFEKLHAMQDEIKHINSIKKDDIVVFFIDALRGMDVYHKDESGEYHADMFKSYLKDAAVFANVKSTAVTTYESMASVIRQKYPYEQNVYENNILSELESFPTGMAAVKQGYDIRMYVSEGYQILHNNSNIEFIKQVYVSSKLWKLTTDMACEKNKSFNMIYVPYELHFPLICGYHKDRPQISGFVDVGVKDTGDFVPRQLEECKNYVDKQYEYYYDWFSDDMLITFFSDHSQVVYDNIEQKPYFMYYNNQDRCVNCTFFVKGFGIEHRWYTKLVSLLDFNDIMKELIESKQLICPNREIAIYQYYKIHYKKLREYAVVKGLEDYIDGVSCYTSVRYLYVITATGVEEVYDLEDDMLKNIIYTKEGRNFRDKIQKEYKPFFPDFILE